MHPRQILAALILPVMAVAAPNPTIYAQFKSKVTELEQSVAAEKTPEKRIAVLLAGNKALAELRKGKPRQEETEELSMSLFLSAFADLPSAKKFDPKKCPEYTRTSRSMMVSRDPSNPDDPMLSRALDLINKVCAN